MLLIVNYRADLPGGQLLALAGQVVKELTEKEADTCLITINLLPEANAPPAVAEPAALKWGLSEPVTTFDLGYDPLTCEFNRLGETLLRLVGLDNQTSEDGWWQDSGPVVMIPPMDSVVSLFLAHAIVHYLTDTGAWSALYILTYFDPIRLQEWD